MSALASQLEVARLDVAALAIGLLGGLAIFLYGMEKMTGALRTVAGVGVRRVLAGLTRNRVTAALSGAFVTAVIQSSSVTTVLVVGFISAGLMSLEQSVGVILGANVGTTITAQIIAFNVTEYALLLVAVGFVPLSFSKRDLTQRIGAMVMGLGLIFLGMALMSDATRPLRTHEPFIAAMASMQQPFLGLLAGAAFTAVVQSSSATTGIVIVLASQGFITLEAGIALALGANVGTCVTALLAAIGKPRVALQAATVHALFNAVGAALWIGFLGPFAAFVRAVSPETPDLEGLARLSAEVPRQIANAHTLFNVSNTLLFLPFTRQIARAVARLLPERPAEPSAELRPRFLDAASLTTPAVALERLRLEAARFGREVNALFEVVPATIDDPATHAAELDRQVRALTPLYDGMVDFARKLLAKDLSRKEGDELQRLLQAVGDFQSMAETIGLNVHALAREWAQRRLRASADTRVMIREFRKLVSDSVRDAAAALQQRDVALAKEVIHRKPQVAAAAERLGRRIGERLHAGDPDRLAIYRLENHVIEVLRRIYYFAKRVAKTVAVDVEEQQTPPPGSPPSASQGAPAPGTPSPGAPSLGAAVPGAPPPGPPAG